MNINHRTALSRDTLLRACEQFSTDSTPQREAFMVRISGQLPAIPDGILDAKASALISAADIEMLCESDLCVPYTGKGKRDLLAGSLVSKPYKPDNFFRTIEGRVLLELVQAYLFGAKDCTIEYISNRIGNAYTSVQNAIGTLRAYEIGPKARFASEAAKKYEIATVTRECFRFQKISST